MGNFRIRVNLLKASKCIVMEDSERMDCGNAPQSRGRDIPK